MVYTDVYCLIFHYDESDATERDAIEGGKELIKHDLNELGPMSAREWRLIVISILLLICWSTEKYFTLSIQQVSL